MDHYEQNAIREAYSLLELVPKGVEIEHHLNTFGEDYFIVLTNGLEDLRTGNGYCLKAYMSGLCRGLKLGTNQ